jgi:CheY-like chemotaxis protein
VTAAEVTILLVDDNKFDTMSLKRSFLALNFRSPIIEVRSCVKAMDMLRGENGHEAMPWPLVILLDLGMQGMSGFEFLERLREDPNLCPVPVFVMSGSESAKDRIRAYDLNIIGFIPKGKSSTSFLKVVEMLKHYLQVVEFPARPSVISIGADPVYGDTSPTWRGSESAVSG